MIKLIVGTKGSGKTKAMIDQINDAVKIVAVRHAVHVREVILIPAAAHQPCAVFSRMLFLEGVEAGEHIFQAFGMCGKLRFQQGASVI